MLAWLRRWLFRRRYKGFRFHAFTLPDGAEFTLRSLANFERDALLLALSEARVAESVIRMHLVRECCLQHYHKSMRTLGMQVSGSEVAQLADEILKLSGMTSEAMEDAEKKPEAAQANDSTAS